MTLRTNWFKDGWRDSHSALAGTIDEDGSNLTGADPGFEDLAGQDFHLADGSVCIDSGGLLDPAAAAAHTPVEQYVVHQAFEPRGDDGQPDIGAYEQCPPGGCEQADAGVDAGEDGGADAGADPGPDAGQDAGEDAGDDPGPDASPDAGEDAGADPGPDAGQDAGEDAGVDSGQDAEPDAGTDPVPGKVSGGCGCASPGRTTWPGGALLLLLLSTWARASARRRAR